MALATITTGVATGGSNNHATSAAELNGVATDFITSGCVGTLGNASGAGPCTGSFGVSADGTPDMGVAVNSGSAYITATPTGQVSQVLRATATANTTAYTINANVSGSTKYDFIYLQVSPTNAATPSSAGDNITALYTSRSSSNTVDNGSPPTYGTLLAIVTVANGASSITNSNIVDMRTQASITGSPATTGWNSLTYTPSSVTYNGNRSYSAVFNSVDLTGTLSPGMRVRTSRTVAAPTQCTSLNGTTQFYSRASGSVAGMTFTNNFTVSGWIRPNSYAGGIIASRYNGTSGWYFYMNTSGQIQLIGFNAGAANFSYVQSNQSVSLNKWTHITAQLDMATFTATPTTSYVMIDGVDVPATVSRGGTNPTALVQAGNLEIGSDNGGTNPFPGKLAQVAIYNAKVTQANIRLTMSQGLAGTETSLISAYSFNNSISDLNANANNLTANGSAVATNADSPFGTQASGLISSTLDYGIITSSTFSTNTTVVVQVPEGCAIPTSGGVSAVAYSPHKSPYGFPAQRGKWQVITRGISATQTNPVNNTWYNISSSQLNVPVGEWVLGYRGSLGADFSLSTTAFTAFTLSTSASSESDADLTSLLQTWNALGTIASINRDKAISISSAIPYYLIGRVTSANGADLYFGGGAPIMILAELAYL